MKKIVVIVGPTCSGKTGLAIDVKKNIPQINLINGDSVQVYRELNIGSDKLDKSLQALYPHQMLDVVSINDYYSVFNFQKDVRQLLEQLDYPLIVGGSGFYIKSVLSDYRFVNEKHDPQKLNYLLSLPVAEQIAFIKNHDPDLDIPFANERKRQRAIVSILNGVLPSQNKYEDNNLYDSLIIYLDINRQTLLEKVQERILNQLKRGFKQEVEGLKPSWEKLKNILGYREMISLINGEISEDEYINSLTSVTMKLAKKQKTWFKNKMNIILVDALDPNLSKTVTLLIKKHFNL